MSTFEVTKAEYKKSFDGKSGGSFNVYEVELKDAEGFTAAEMVTKSDAAGPRPGETVEGEITPGPYGNKFKKAFQGGGGGFKGKSPKENAQIARMNAQTQALKLLGLT